MRFWEPLAAYWSRKRWERLRYEAACKLLEGIAAPAAVCEDPDAARWRLVSPARRKDRDDEEAGNLRDQARRLVEINPFARNALTLLRNYVVGTGMRHEAVAIATASDDDPRIEGFSPPLNKGRLGGVRANNPLRLPLSKGGEKSLLMHDGMSCKRVVNSQQFIDSRCAPRGNGGRR